VELSTATITCPTSVWAQPYLGGAASTGAYRQIEKLADKVIMFLDPFSGLRLNTADFISNRKRMNMATLPRRKTDISDANGAAFAGQNTIQLA